MNPGAAHRPGGAAGPRFPARRRLLRTAAAAALVVGAMGWRAASERHQRPPAHVLRPPGAVPERSFVASCLRCGLCVDACPFGTLKLAGTDGPAVIGTPYFTARQVPCEMCKDMPCVRACPTGALSPRLHRIADARMGVARLAYEERCYSFIGAAYCRACYLACQLRGRAIRMKNAPTRRGGRFTPTVDAERCTGCGKCEKACAAADAAITVTALPDRDA
jgi:ferredoxin-type protein NapG